MTTAEQHIRPVNLRTDLGALADLIELVFSSSMDEGGRAAIREMRYMSRMGMGLSVLSRLNEMMLGIKMGFVWVEAGRLVGNVSIYPANLPGGQHNTWIIANVGVHPAYQGRGIAYHLMQRSLAMLRQRGGQAAILQVDYSNQTAIRLYERLGFHRERAFGQWRRGGLSPITPAIDTGVFITRRRRREWEAEYRLAQQVRPNHQGGMGWLKPTVPTLFHKGLWQTFTDTLTLNSNERTIVRSSDERDIMASLWLENNLGSFSTRLMLMCRPDAQPAADALLSNAVRRNRSSTLMLEHPLDDLPLEDTFRRLSFHLDRSVWHMQLALATLPAAPAE